MYSMQSAPSYRSCPAFSLQGYSALTNISTLLIQGAASHFNDDIRQSVLSSLRRLIPNATESLYHQQGSEVLAPGKEYLRHQVLYLHNSSTSLRQLPNKRHTFVRMVRAGRSNPDDPLDFCCPISGEVMEDPVVLQTGQTFDRKSIQNWFRGHSTCPVTGEELTSIQLTPNFALKAMIQTWKDRQPASSPSSSESSPQNGAYPTVQGSMYPNLATDGRPQDSLAQVQAALVKLKEPSMDMPSYRQQRIYDLWTLAELMQDPTCCHELLSQQGLPAILRCLHDDNTAECRAASARIVQRLAKCTQGAGVFDAVLKSGNLERLTQLLSISDPAKAGRISCREAAATALRDLAATSPSAQSEVFFQLCAKAKQLDGLHRQQLTIVAPLQLLWQMNSLSESAAAASLVVQVTKGMALKEYINYCSCEGTAAIPTLVEMLNSKESDVASAAIKALLYSPANQNAMILQLVDGLTHPPKGREAAGRILWTSAAANPNLVGVYSGVPTMAAALETALRVGSFAAAGLAQLLAHDHPRLSNSVVAAPNTDAVRTQLISHEQILPSLIRLLYSEDQLTAQAAIHALANLTAYRSGAGSDSGSGRFSLGRLQRTSSSNMQHPSWMVADSSAMPRLIALLDCPVPGIVAPALALLNNLCAENETRDKVRDAGKEWGLDRLLQRLNQLMAWGMLPEKCRAAARVSQQRLTSGRLAKAPDKYAFITLLLPPPPAAGES